jgi:hypothetical protein
VATSPTVGRVPTDGWFGRRRAPTAGASTYHRGVDIAAPEGTAVVAPEAGTVTLISRNSVRGLYVIVQHDARYRTLHQHLDSTPCYQGQRVVEAQLIGRVGQTGVATGPHLHTEVHDHGTPIDPRPWYAARGVPTLGARTKVAGVHVEASMSAEDVAALKAHIDTRLGITEKAPNLPRVLLGADGYYRVPNRQKPGEYMSVIDALATIMDYAVRGYVEANAAKKAAGDATADVDEAALAAELAPLLTAVAPALSDGDLAALAAAVNDEADRRARERLG